MRALSPEWDARCRFPRVLRDAESLHGMPHAYVQVLPCQACSVCRVSVLTTSCLSTLYFFLMVVMTMSRLHLQHYNPPLGFNNSKSERGKKQVLYEVSKQTTTSDRDLILTSIDQTPNRNASVVASLPGLSIPSLAASRVHTLQSESYQTCPVLPSGFTARKA